MSTIFLTAAAFAQNQDAPVKSRVSSVPADSISSAGTTTAKPTKAVMEKIIPTGKKKPSNAEPKPERVQPKQDVNSSPGKKEE